MFSPVTGCTIGLAKCSNMVGIAETANFMSFVGISNAFMVHFSFIARMLIACCVMMHWCAPLGMAWYIV